MLLVSLLPRRHGADECIRLLPIQAPDVLTTSHSGISETMRRSQPFSCGGHLHGVLPLKQYRNAVYRIRANRIGFMYHTFQGGES
jgi:hypothetical protein